MSAAIKLGTTTVMLATVTTGVYFLTARGSMPEWHPLAANSHNGKYASKYLSFLVGDTESKNTAWWDWSYKHRFLAQKTRADGFADTSITDGTKLKEACAKAYGGTEETSEAKIKVTAEGSSEVKYGVADLWNFCSPLGAKPSTVAQKNSGDYSGKIGSTDGKKDKFVSVTDKSRSNRLFWTIRHREFYGSEGFTKITVDSSHTFFKTEQDKAKGDDRKYMRDICREAYETATPADGGGSGTSASPTAEQALKYCSLEKS